LTPSGRFGDDRIVPDQLTLDVLDRPADGLLGSMRRLRAVRRDGAPGLRSLIQLGTAQLAPGAAGAPAPSRIAVLAAWEDRAGLDGVWSAALGKLCAGAREHWHVRGELAQVSSPTPWRRWAPSAGDAQPLGDDDPALVLGDGSRAAAPAPDAPGLLCDVGITTSPLKATSCTAWRRYADARRELSDWFLVVRPLAERGTLDGAARFDALLAEVPSR